MHTDLTAAYDAARRHDLLREAETARQVAATGAAGRRSRDRRYSRPETAGIWKEVLRRLRCSLGVSTAGNCS